MHIKDHVTEKMEVIHDDTPPEKEILEKLSTREEGLVETELQERLQTYNYNGIIEKKINPVLKFLRCFWGPIPWMLEVAAIISAVIQNGPILLGVRAYLPIPGGKPKKFKVAAQAGQIRPTTTPDLDSLLKQFKGSCKGIFWPDDKQVVGYLPETWKYYGNPARWEIEIKSLL